MPVFVPLFPTAEPINFFYVLSFFHHVNNKKCSYSSDHSCLSSDAIFYEALCYRVCLRWSESFLAHMEISFQCIICCAMYTCKYICHRKFARVDAAYFCTAPYINYTCTTIILTLFQNRAPSSCTGCK